MSHFLTAKTGCHTFLQMALAAVWLTIAGCSGGSDQTPSGSVSGKVSLKGAPVAAGRVNFLGKGAGASADLKPDGTYQLEGRLPVGDYAVSITAAGLGDQPPSEDPQKDQAAQLNLPKKYQSESTSGLTVKVVQGSNSFPFDLTE